MAFMKHRRRITDRPRDGRDRLRRARIVVAEDDPDMRALLVAALKRDDYEIIEARDGWELLQYVTAQHLPAQADDDKVDLVVSDIRMPGISGLHVLEGMRCCDSETPVILITAFGDFATHDEASRLGASVFNKPFDLEDLRTAVCNLVP